MNAADESLGNVLLVGLGAVAIQVALDLRRHGAGRLGALNHPGRRSQRIAEALARGACLQLEGQGQHHWLSGNAALDVFHQDPAELRDDWQTLVLCVPADSYLDVVRGLPWERLGGVRTLLLVSAFIGANLLVRSALPAGCQATVLSLSSYYAATKVIDETQPLRALTKAVKRRVYLGSSRTDCPARETWRRVLAGSGVEVVPLATPEAAEGRNVTTYVHSPFFLGEFALARILSEQGPPGFMYKLYPEGPITPGAIGAMRRLWCELSELLRRMGAEPLNLLRFLNDDNYPVHETMLPRAAIDGFAEAGAERQEYLLFVRYAALLVDPFSPADEQGRHFDFSAVPFRRVSRDEDGLWRLPRVPLEDYRKLALIVALAAHFDLAMPQARSLLASYENAVSRFIDCQGASQCHPSLYPIDSRPAADAIYRQWCSTC
ncbi:pseudopaline biosynthesis dehydrogenase CntM [Pseudomonas aeruginosa]|uniref:pseudopaline biosynthesis dehydrogenase CntM n=1 Tax=Pseudomonas aeruginosa TaxID=287 RepID=UPI000936F9B6|nr:pseudopaline biosynthesis dehydrogenase CntM [Pseudomonas aeruginosa]